MPEIIRLQASASYGHTGQYVARLTGRDSKFTFAREFIGRRSERTSTADVDDAGLYEICDVDRRGGKDSTYWVVAKVGDELYKFAASKAEAMKIAKAFDDGRKLEDVVSPWLSCRELRDVAEAIVKWKFFLSTTGSNVVVPLDLPGGGESPALLASSSACPQDPEVARLVADELARLDAEASRLEAEGKQPYAGFSILSPKAAAAARAGRMRDGIVADIMAALSSLDAKDAKAVLAEVAKTLK